MIDFDALVLNRTVGIFGIAVRFTPLVSQPLVAAYDGRGVYSKAPLDVDMEGSALFSDHTVHLGIRLWDFTIPPGQGDTVEITDIRHPAYGQIYRIEDDDEDGQGGAMLLLKKLEPQP